MKEELEQKLIDRFAALIGDYRDFSVGDGWYQLLYDMLEKIEYVVLPMEDQERKIEHVMSKLDGSPLFRLLQVKEKFGCLRVYFDVSNTERTMGNHMKINNIVGFAEKHSEHTCEDCGQPGQIRNRSRWMKALCNRCNETLSK